jgi:hypothetical protein
MGVGAPRIDVARDHVAGHGAIAAALLAAITLLSLAVNMPFTEQYARETVSRAQMRYRSRCGTRISVRLRLKLEAQRSG